MTGHDLRSCRCDNCRRRRTRYANLRRLDILHGKPRTVDGTGTRRRLQALHAIGWSSEELGAHLGITRVAVNNLLRRDSVVRAATRARVIAVYDELWDVTPPPMHGKAAGIRNRIKARAARLGWVPPMGWDDDTIDDPAAVPDLGDQDRESNRGRPVEHTAEDVEFLLDENPLATAAELAHRLGFADQKGIQNALKRAARPDLLETLARNARLNQGKGAAA